MSLQYPAVNNLLRPVSPSHVSTFSSCLSASLSPPPIPLVVSPHSPYLCQHSLLPCSTCRVSTLSRSMSTLFLTLFHLVMSPHSPDVCQHSLLPCSTCRVSTFSKCMSTLSLTLFHLSCLHSLQMYVNTLSYPVPPSRVSTLSR